MDSGLLLCCACILVASSRADGGIVPTVSERVYHRDSSKENTANVSPNPTSGVQYGIPLDLTWGYGEHRDVSSPQESHENLKASSGNPSNMGQYGIPLSLAHAHSDHSNVLSSYPNAHSVTVQPAVLVRRLSFVEGQKMDSDGDMSIQKLLEFDDNDESNEVQHSTNAFQSTFTSDSHGQHIGIHHSARNFNSASVSDSPDHLYDNSQYDNTRHGMELQAHGRPPVGSYLLPELVLGQGFLGKVNDENSDHSLESDHLSADSLRPAPDKNDIQNVISHHRHDADNNSSSEDNIMHNSVNPQIPEHHMVINHEGSDDQSLGTNLFKINRVPLIFGRYRPTESQNSVSNVYHVQGNPATYWSQTHNIGRPLASALGNYGTIVNSADVRNDNNVGAIHRNNLSPGNTRVSYDRHFSYSLPNDAGSNAKDSEETDDSEFINTENKHGIMNNFRDIKTALVEHKASVHFGVSEQSKDNAYLPPVHGFFTKSRDSNDKRPQYISVSSDTDRNQEDEGELNTGITSDKPDNAADKDYSNHANANIGYIAAFNLMQRELSDQMNNDENNSPQQITLGTYQGNDHRNYLSRSYGGTTDLIHIGSPAFGQYRNVAVEHRGLSGLRPQIAIYVKSIGPQNLTNNNDVSVKEAEESEEDSDEMSDEDSSESEADEEASGSSKENGEKPEEDNDEEEGAEDENEEQHDGKHGESQDSDNNDGARSNHRQYVNPYGGKIWPGVHSAPTIYRQNEPSWYGVASPFLYHKAIGRPYETDEINGHRMLLSEEIMEEIMNGNGQLSGIRNGVSSLSDRDSEEHLSNREEGSGRRNSGDENQNGPSEEEFKDSQGEKKPTPAAPRRATATVTFNLGLPIREAQKYYS